MYAVAVAAPKNLARWALASLGLVTALSAAPSAAWADVAYNVGVVTDYRYRGLSQSRLKPAIQGGVDYTQGGLYLGLWASSIKWVSDAGGGADVEVDLYGGFKGEIQKGLGYDVGLLAYQYPGHGLNPSPNTLEVYGALTFGQATLKYSHATSNLFGFANSKGSGYLDLSATVDVGGFSLTPHIGHQTVKNLGAASYTDYSLTISKDMGNGLSLSATVVDTDASGYVSPAGKNLGKTGLVLGAKFSF